MVVVISAEAASAEGCDFLSQFDVVLAQFGNLVPQFRHWLRYSFRRHRRPFLQP